MFHGIHRTVRDLRKKTNTQKKKEKSPERYVICKADFHPNDQPKGLMSVHFANYMVCRGQQILSRSYAKSLHRSEILTNNTTSVK